MRGTTMLHIARALRRALAIALALTIAIIALPTTAMADSSYSAIVSVSKMKVFSSASLDEKVGTLKKNIVVTVLSVSKGIAKIEYKNKIGYAYISEMDSVESVAIKATVNKKAYVYKSKSTSS